MGQYQVRPNSSEPDGALMWVAGMSVMAATIAVLWACFYFWVSLPVGVPGALLAYGVWMTHRRYQIGRQLRTAEERAAQKEKRATIRRITETKEPGLYQVLTTPSGSPYYVHAGDADLATRIGYEEREDALTRLGDHFAAGRLDADEFEHRAGMINAAKIGMDLVAPFKDLPKDRTR